MIQHNLYWKDLYRLHRYDIATIGVTFVVVLLVMSSCVGLYRVFEPMAEQPAIVALAPEADPVEKRAASADEILKTATLAKPTGTPAIRPAVVAPVTPLSSIQSGIASILETKPVISEKKVVVGRGDTLMDLLVKKALVSREDAFHAVQALSKVYDPRDILPGREIRVFFHKEPDERAKTFTGIRLEKDVVSGVTVNRNSAGDYTVNETEKQVSRGITAFKGVIENSLYVDANAAGVPDAVIIELIKMYSWNVDFQREIHRGDKFEVMFEQYKTSDGKTVPGKGNIIYAKLALSGEDMPFYRFEDVHGDADYYDARGMSAKKPLMKTPVDGARLTSGFGKRTHPVLGYTKMHKGLDFGAPRGTPIYAAGDGTIAKMGPYSSYGNYVRIRHRQGLETAYAHMRGFKQGLRAGSRVKQGDVIGYVGTTGRSTGPHLHYEVIVNSAQVNPSSVKLPTGRALKGKELKTFQRNVAMVREKFQTIRPSTAIAENHTQTHKAGTVAKN